MKPHRLPMPDDDDSYVPRSEKHRHTGLREWAKKHLSTRQAMRWAERDASLGLKDNDIAFGDVLRRRRNFPAKITTL